VKVYDVTAQRFPKRYASDAYYTFVCAQRKLISIFRHLRYILCVCVCFLFAKRQTYKKHPVRNKYKYRLCFAICSNRSVVRVLRALKPRTFIFYSELPYRFESIGTCRYHSDRTCGHGTASRATRSRTNLPWFPGFFFRIRLTVHQCAPSVKAGMILL